MPLDSATLVIPSDADILYIHYIAVDPEFNYITEDLEQAKKRLAENQVSLSIEKRRSEIEEEKARKEKRIAERAQRTVPEPKRFSITLDNVGKPELQLVTNDKKKDGTAEAEEKPAVGADDDDGEDDAESKKPVVDAVRNEAVNVLADLAELSRGAKTPATASAKTK